MKNIRCLLSGMFILFIACGKVPDSVPVLSGHYMGQVPPGMSAELFAPGIISNELCNRDVAMTPDGKEMYFGVHTPDFRFSTILVSREVNGVWTAPEAASFARDPRYAHLEPAVSPDGKKLFFLSDMPKDDTDRPADDDIWVVDREGDSWGAPYNLGAPVNTDGNEFFPSLTRDGSMYFTRADAGSRVHFIYRSRLVDGRYAEPEKLPGQVNCGTNRYNAYVAPDERYLVVPAVNGPGSLGGTDYYIVFRNEDDTWQEPVNMGEKFNSPAGGEWSFYVSPDGKYAFFMATRGIGDERVPRLLNYQFFRDVHAGPENGNSDIYWIDAQILDTFRK